MNLLDPLSWDTATPAMPFSPARHADTLAFDDRRSRPDATHALMRLIAGFRQGVEQSASTASLAVMAAATLELAALEFEPGAGHAPSPIRGRSDWHRCQASLEALAGTLCRGTRPSTPELVHAMDPLIALLIQTRIGLSACLEGSA